MTRLLLILLSVFFVSCRCSTDYKAVSNNIINQADTTISASAKMWQGQYEYLGIVLQIKRNDSLFVNNILIKPALKKGVFYPKFNHFTMYSFYYGDPKTLGYKGQYDQGEYWQDYLADTFDKLPKENRQTNKGGSYITYTAHYNSEKAIDFEDFSADVEVQLIDKEGNVILHKRHFDFQGERECRLSAH